MKFADKFAENGLGDQMKEMWAEIQQHIGFGFFIGHMTSGASKIFALGGLSPSIVHGL